jgi:hypothetical protein
MTRFFLMRGDTHIFGFPHFFCRRTRDNMNHLMLTPASAREMLAVDACAQYLRRLRWIESAIYLSIWIGLGCGPTVIFFALGGSFYNLNGSFIPGDAGRHGWRFSVSCSSRTCGFCGRSAGRNQP